MVCADCKRRRGRSCSEHYKVLSVLEIAHSGDASRFGILFVKAQPYLDIIWSLVRVIPGLISYSRHLPVAGRRQMGDRSLTRDLMHIVWLVTVKQPL